MTEPEHKQDAEGAPCSPPGSWHHMSDHKYWCKCGEQLGIIRDDEHKDGTPLDLKPAKETT